MNSASKRIIAATVFITAGMIAFFCIRSFKNTAPVTTGNVAVSKENTKHIALTFDDGPNTTTTNQVLDILEKYNAKASFFLIGENINSRSAKSVKRAYDMGCEINNHSLTHSDMAEMSEKDIRAEIGTDPRNNRYLSFILPSSVYFGKRHHVQSDRHTVYMR